MRKLFVSRRLRLRSSRSPRVASRENIYTVDGSTSPKGKGSKSKPVPVGLEVQLRRGQRRPARRATPIKIYAIGSEGLRDLPEAVPDLHVLSGDEHGSRLAEVQEGEGRRRPRAERGRPGGDLSLTDKLFCNLKLTLYNISGAGKKAAWPSGSTAIRRRRRAGTQDDRLPDADPQRDQGEVRDDEDRWAAGRRAALHGAAELLHPSGLDNSVRNNESTIARRRPRRRSRQEAHVGYYSAIGCKGGKRTIRSTFTDEQGDKKNATKEEKC